MPQTRKVNHQIADVAKIAEGFAKLPLRERIILRLALVLGLRPGEILALRRDDIFPKSLRVDEGNVDGKLWSPKTEASVSHVWMTPEIKAEIDFWLSLEATANPDSLVFRSPSGKPIHLDNYRKRILCPALEKAGLKGTTLQMCRRTCSTIMLNNKHGNLKDVQNHLRHAQASTTLGIYVQEIPESVQGAVASLDKALFGAVPATDSKPN
jgi:integrase